MNISAEQQREIDALCERYAVRGLRIFGSAALATHLADMLGFVQKLRAGTTRLPWRQIIGLRNILLATRGRV